MVKTEKARRFQGHKNVGGNVAAMCNPHNVISSISFQNTVFLFLNDIRLCHNNINILLLLLSSQLSIGKGVARKKLREGPNLATFNVTSFTYHGIFK